VESSGVREEPISSELVLVDEELARSARDALPDPPWLLPVLAELREAEKIASPAAASELPVPAVPARRRGPSVASRARAAAAVVLSLLGLVVLGALALSLLPSSRGPTLAARPEEQASLPAPPQSLGAGRPRRAAKHPKARRTATRQATTKAKPTAPKVRTKPRAVTPARERAAKPRPLTVPRAKRVFTWHRYPGAVYYQFYFQQGAKTIYQARTVRPTAALPARLKAVRGTYRVVVRPAVPSDAGIILGGAVFEKTVKL
jgi:hypothetical protein